MDNGNNPTSSSRVSFHDNLTQSTSSPLRRSRADTMPSQSSAFPYADLFSNLTLNTSTNSTHNVTATTLPNVGLISRHRSGSVTLPNDVNEEKSYTPFYYDPSSPIDENASNTIASTLASLGLDDEEEEEEAEKEKREGKEQQNTMYEGRTRAYTMTTNDPMRFSPFSPHTRSSVLHRPRAISLGMVDNFSPFDMNGGQTTSTSTTTNNNTSTRFTQLRSSRSSNNLVDLNDSLEEDVYVTMIPITITIKTNLFLNVGLLWST